MISLKIYSRFLVLLSSSTKSPEFFGDYNHCIIFASEAQFFFFFFFSFFFFLKFSSFLSSHQLPAPSSHQFSSSSFFSRHVTPSPHPFSHFCFVFFCFFLNLVIFFLVSFVLSFSFFADLPAKGRTPPSSSSSSSSQPVTQSPTVPAME